MANDSAAADLSRFARDTPDEPFDMTDAMERDGCTRKGCGRPMSEHEWGVFCP
jgi:hypothetical protein